MLRFFDRYLKGEQNGWEQTPRVRLSLIGMGDHAPLVNLPEAEYPLARTEYRRLYLDCARHALVDGGPPTAEYVTSYRADAADGALGDRAEFTYVFARETRLAGYPKLRVYVSCADHDDLVRRHFEGRALRAR